MESDTKKRKKNAIWLLTTHPTVRKQQPRRAFLSFDPTTYSHILFCHRESRVSFSVSFSDPSRTRIRIGSSVTWLQIDRPSDRKWIVTFQVKMRNVLALPSCTQRNPKFIVSHLLYLKILCTHIEDIFIRIILVCI